MAQLPHMEDEEIEFFDKLFNLDIEKKVFEWGSGWSTVRWCEDVEEWYAVEHNKRWVNLIKEKSNLKTVYYEEEDELGYIYSPEKHDIPFNIFIVDGRYRLKCIEYVDICERDDSIIFLHDNIAYEDYLPGFVTSMQYIDLFEGGKKLKQTGKLKQGGLRMYYKPRAKEIVEKVLTCV